MAKRMMLYAIVSSQGIVKEETCLCSNDYTKTNVEWHSLSYPEGDGYAWLEFDPISEFERNQSIDESDPTETRQKRELVCNVCGYPIDRNIYTGIEEEN